MISVDQALRHITDLFSVVESEDIALENGAGRILAEPITAKRDQPPFPASAMDGYAVRRADLNAGRRLKLVGESAAGSRYTEPLPDGAAVRIFTGGPVPLGADHILIQEDAIVDAGHVTPNPDFEQVDYIRPAGGDFKAGDRVEAPKRLTPSTLSLLAAMGCATVPVRRKPRIALVPTGNELVNPGTIPNPDQIFCSNTFGIKALIEEAGGSAKIMPIAPDKPAPLAKVLDLASDADCIVTLGGASVGDHDLLGQMARNSVFDTHFYKVAMRPGKPLMAGRYQGTPIIGLPGNPVSALVCAYVFLRPALNSLLGLSLDSDIYRSAILAEELPHNGPRTHYMRAVVWRTDNGTVIKAQARQDSSLLSVINQSNALLIVPANEPAQPVGTSVRYLPLDTSSFC